MSQVVTDSSSNLVKVTCPTHHETLIRALWALFQAKKGTDINIRSGERVLRAHGIVVSAFLSAEKLMENNLNNDGLNLDALVQFLYTGTVLVERPALDDLERAATLLDFAMLLDAVRSAKAGNENSDVPASSTPAEKRGDDIRQPEAAVELVEPKPEPEEAVNAGRKRDGLVFLDETSGVMQIGLDADDVTDNEVTSPVASDDMDPDVEIISGPSVATGEADCEVIELSDDDDDDGKEQPAKGRVTRPKKGLGKKRPYKCPLCPKEFVFRRSLTGHKKTHNGERSHKCDVCRKKFASRSILAAHKHTHGKSKPFKCDVCSASFALRDRLAAHKLTHSDDRLHKCGQCGKEFKRGDVLTRHLLTHSKTKAHECKICHKRFAVKSYLTVHSRKHSGEKPYKCKGCDLVFAYSSQCRVHERIHDNLFDWPS